MKERYFVYNKSIPLQRSRDWSDTVDKMTLGGTPPTPARVSVDLSSEVPTLFTQIAPITSPLTTTPIVDTETIFQKNRQFQAAGLTLPALAAPMALPGASNGAGGDVIPGSFNMFGTTGFYTPNGYGID